ALYAGTMAGLLAAGGLRRETAALWVAATAMFVLGVVDDRLRLRAHVKLVGQIAAACWLLLNHVHFEAIPMPWTLPVTLLWLIGITNAVNLLDNMDGLAVGVVGIAALVISANGLIRGDMLVASMALP